MYMEFEVKNKKKKKYENEMKRLVWYACNKT